VIRAEHLARLGSHEEALALFLDLPTRGLPLFSDGLTYAIDRLRSYTEIRGLVSDPSSLSRALRLLRKLQYIASKTDFNSPVVQVENLEHTQLSLEPLVDDKAVFDSVATGPVVEEGHDVPDYFTNQNFTNAYGFKIVGSIGAGGLSVGGGTGAAPGLAAMAQEYGQTIAGAASTAKDYVSDKMSVVGDKIGELRNKDFSEVASDAKEYARQNPGQALLISAAAGFVLGLLIRGSRR
jgi:ElaB/YqjD/DUF883 family membrane-anchored ribosome-binding protein